MSQSSTNTIRSRYANLFSDFILFCKYVALIPIISASRKSERAPRTMPKWIGESPEYSELKLTLNAMKTVMEVRANIQNAYVLL